MRRTPALRALISTRPKPGSASAHRAVVRQGRHRRCRPDWRGLPGQFQHTWNHSQGSRRYRVARRTAFAVPERKDADGFREPRTSGRHRATRVHDAARRARRRARGDRRPCPGRVHGPRPLACSPTSATWTTTPTLERYRSIALAQAEAAVRRRGMMDGQVAAIHDALDASGRGNIGIVAYAAKFASALYGPFPATRRSARRGSTRWHQLPRWTPPTATRRTGDPHRHRPGTDIVMVKPAVVPGRDHPPGESDGVPDGRVPRVRRIRDRGRSRRAGRRLRQRRVVLETLTSIRRRGRRPDPHVPREGSRDWLTERA